MFSVTDHSGKRYGRLQTTGSNQKQTKMKIETLTNTGILWQINRHREYLEAQIQKRKAIGYVIKILVVIATGILCWHFAP